jgi:hypothetical protein
LRVDPSLVRRHPNTVTESPELTNPDRRDLFSKIRAFLDFLVLFSGISTRSNLARTQGRSLRSRGIFLFRPK